MTDAGQNYVEVADSELTVNGNSLHFANTIRDHVDFGEFVVLDLSLGSDDPKFNQNVVAVDPDGSVRWRIDKCPHESGGGHDSYAGLFREDDELWVSNLNGMKYRVDTRDGSIVDSKFVK